MPHNPSRSQLKTLEADTQRVVDEYKSRSIWGLWWSLGEDIRSRYFNDDERRWIRAHGAKLDEIACLIREPANDKEHHFLEVCKGRAQPRNERERLWLRAQVVCRHVSLAERAARADYAEHRTVALEAENLQLRRDLREAEEVAMESIVEIRMLTGKDWTASKRSVCNVEWATSRFVELELVGPPPVRWISHVAHRGAPTQTFPPCRSRVAQGFSPST